jgi:hypothetical protein
MSDNKYIWNLVKQPPKSALKVINAGRLKGKSDINPQWRYEAMTDVFGMCGDGWKYTIDKLWTEPATEGQVFVFAQVSVYIKDPIRHTWTDPIQGIGGSMLISKEKEGLHSSDEGYKMSVTDALGTAMKMIGVAADIYSGKWDGSKYIGEEQKTARPIINKEPDIPEFVPEEFITLEQQTTINGIIIDKDVDREAFLRFMGASSVDEIKESDYQKALNALRVAKGRKAA